MGWREVRTTLQVGVPIGGAVPRIYSPGGGDGQVRWRRGFVRYEDVVVGEMIEGRESRKLGEGGGGVISHDIGEGVAIVVAAVL